MKMIPRQILEGLRRHNGGGCWEYDKNDERHQCPYYDDDNCHQHLLNDAVSLIEKQRCLEADVYLEIKREWNQRRANHEQPTNAFLVHLMEMIEERDDEE